MKLFDINLDCPEGKLLVVAVAVLCAQADKDPDEIMEILVAMAIEVYGELKS